jgi:hypothetical protein
LDISRIPPELVEKTHELDRRFSSRSPRFFAADWGFDRNLNDWKLFELNGFPGIANPLTDGDAARQYIQLLAQGLVNAARKDLYAK